MASEWFGLKIGEELKCAIQETTFQLQIRDTLKDQETNRN